MASFDIVEAAGNGYRIVWAERRYLLRLAFVPVLVKFVCMMVVLSLGVRENMLQQALISLPAFFTEGWLLAHFCRMMFLGQRWPFQPTGDATADERVLRDRFRGVMSGMVTYVLIGLGLSGAFHFLLAFEAMAESSPEEVSTGMLFIAMGLMAVMIWAFRLMWLYIPAALNYPMTHFMRVFSGFSSSFYMIGVWLVCFVPLTFCYYFLAALIFSVFGDAAALEFVVLMGQVCISVITTLIATAGVGSGIRVVMLPDQTKSRD